VLRSGFSWLLSGVDRESVAVLQSYGEVRVDLLLVELFWVVCLEKTSVGKLCLLTYCKVPDRHCNWLELLLGVVRSITDVCSRIVMI
jgi:hypothetical protein